MLHSGSISDTPKHTMGVCFSEHEIPPTFHTLLLLERFFGTCFGEIHKNAMVSTLQNANPLFFLPSPSICILCFIVQHGKCRWLQAHAFVVIFFALPQQSIALFLCCTKECRVPSVQACNLFKITSFELL